MGGINSRISGRIDDVLRARLDRIHANHRTDDSDFIRDAMSALADYVERTGHYRVPLKIEFDEDTAAMQRQLVAEGSEEGKQIVTEAAKAAAVKAAREKARAAAAKPPRKRAGSDGGKSGGRGGKA